jgi:hypothetical protein
MSDPLRKAHVIFKFGFLWFGRVDWAFRVPNWSRMEFGYVLDTPQHQHIGDVMRRRLFTGVAAAAALAGSLLINGPASAAAAPDTSATATTDSRSGAGVTPNEALAEAIKVTPTENLKAVATLRGVGKQVYDCVGGSWTFREPVAVLATSRGIPAAIHGKGPFWTNFDGSRVEGSGAVPVPAPPATDPPKNVPWLRLKGTPTLNTTGLFSNVTVIQRIDTRGGVAPTGTCTGVATKAVDYTANYVFWAPK